MSRRHFSSRQEFVFAARLTDRSTLIINRHGTSAQALLDKRFPSGRLPQA